MRLYSAPDSDLYAFAGAPRTLQMWFRYQDSQPAVSLSNSWGDLDAILAAEPSVPSQSPLTPQGAEFTYPFAAGRGAYALSSTTTERLLRTIEQVDRAQVEARVQHRWDTATHPEGDELEPVQLWAETEDLMTHLGRLREACAVAVSKGYGLVMALWDDS